MRDINVLEGQVIIVGDSSIVLERIDFNSTKSFIVYTLSEDGSNDSTFEQAILHAGEMIQLMPQVLLAALRVVKGKETYAVVGLDTPHDISIVGE